VTLLGVVLAALVPAPASPDQLGMERTVWIVQLRERPLASSGLDLSTADAWRYSARIDALGEQVLAAAGAGGAPVLYRYRTALAGFAARLTAAEAGRLRASPQVQAVTPDGTRRPRSAAVSGAGAGDGASFLGLAEGLWRRLGGPEHAGEGVVIGIIDTGIHPEHPSFADRPPYPAPKDWRGACQEGEAFPASTCNGKLIGARYFAASFGATRIAEAEFLSARDSDGHGSHVAASAAGNHGVHPAIAGNDFGIPAVSGMAPRAHLAVYKVCWIGRKDPGRQVEDFCHDSDTVAAIDAAVADGVDVLNYSVAASASVAAGPVETALLHAYEAGVFVATAAGNSGPQPGTVGSPAGLPWVTAVAASTLPRTFAADATLNGAGGGLQISGASFTGALDRAPLVDAAAVPAAGADGGKAELCLADSLDPAAVKGKAVLCRRGENPRVEKSRVVADAGGVGMVLYNADDGDSLSADAHAVPTVHVSRGDGMAVKQLLAAGRTEVSIGAARAVPGPGDVVAAFSSRGPQAELPDVPKPDVAAPGVDILGASTPTPAGGEARPGEIFRSLSGTSMASPHVAGAAALLRQLDPSRSPAGIKSALMTTARPAMRNQEGNTVAGPFDMGSGRIDPTRAADAGLVLEVRFDDFLRYLKGLEPALVGDEKVLPLPPGDLNLPAISFSAFNAAATTRRIFTSIDGAEATWEAGTEGLGGIAVAVVPPLFTVAPGQSQTLAFGFALAGAPLGTYVFGAVVLTNRADGRTVRIPVSIRPNKPSGVPLAGGRGGRG
jgi:subtilisin family serine protease